MTAAKGSVPEDGIHYSGFTPEDWYQAFCLQRCLRARVRKEMGTSKKQNITAEAPNLLDENQLRHFQNHNPRNAPESFPDTAEESDSGCRIRARIIAKRQVIVDLSGPELGALFRVIRRLGKTKQTPAYMR